MNMRRYMMLTGGDKRRDYYPESRYRDDRGREHYDNGRYAPTRDYIEYGDRGHIYNMYPMGFASGNQTREAAEMGGAYATGLTREVAEQWVSEMRGEDCPDGEHWSYDQTRQIMQNKGYNLDPVEAYLVMNMMYSDYCKVFKRYGVDRPDFYAELTKAWLDDPDAPEDKTVKYFTM